MTGGTEISYHTFSVCALTFAGQCHHKTLRRRLPEFTFDFLFFLIIILNEVMRITLRTSDPHSQSDEDHSQPDPISWYKKVIRRLSLISSKKRNKNAAHYISRSPCDWCLNISPKIHSGEVSSSHDEINWTSTSGTLPRFFTKCHIHHLLFQLVSQLNVRLLPIHTQKHPHWVRPSDTPRFTFVTYGLELFVFKFCLF